MRLSRVVGMSVTACLVSASIHGSVVSADGGGDSDADAGVDGETIAVSAEMTLNPPGVGGGAPVTESGVGPSVGEGSSSGGGGGGGAAGGTSGWDWERLDTGAVYDSNVTYEPLTLFLGDLMVDGVRQRLFAGDSPTAPGAINDVAWVGPQQAQALAGAAAPGAPAAPPPTADELLPALRDEMQARLQVPEVEFVGRDPEFGWAYVVVPVGFRVVNAAPITVSASVSRAGVTAWVTMTAMPSEVRFVPGEPGGRTVACPPSVAAAPGFDSARPDACSYTYDNTSAIAANGQTFTTSTSMTYEISFQSSSGPGSFPAVTTTSTQELAVAEIQALVTCTGPRPEQGGCG